MNGKKENHTVWSKIWGVILPFLLPIGLLGFWEYGVNTGFIKQSILPAPSFLWETFINMISSGMMWKNLSVSFVRVFFGFLIGASLGIILGYLMGLFTSFNKAFALIISVIRPIPIIAMVPIFILILGINEESKLAIIAVGSFFPILLNTIHGVQSVDPKLLQVGYIYRISPIKRVWRIVFPSAIPSMLTGIRLGVGIAWMSVVAAEMIAASRGIGYLITFSREIAQPHVMYVSVLTIGLIGLCIDKGLTTLQSMYIRKTRGIVK